MQGLAGKLFIAALLTVAVGLYALELSGRWDQTLQDTNDEAGLVAIVLCIGVALSTAAVQLIHHRARRAIVSMPARARTAASRDDHRFALRVPAGSPPTTLRI